MILVLVFLFNTSALHISELFPPSYLRGEVSYVEGFSICRWGIILAFQRICELAVPELRLIQVAFSGSLPYGSDPGGVKHVCKPKDTLDRTGILHGCLNSGNRHIACQGDL